MSLLVTGGTKGIGLAIATRLATPGRKAFLNFHSDAAAAERAAEELAAAGSEPVLVREDVSTPGGCRRLLDTVAEQTDRLDQLVHCAVDPLSGPSLDLDPDRFAAAVSTNGSALLYLTQAASPLLTRGSTVFYLTSRGSRAALPHYAAVGAPKALGESLVRYLALELAPRGVRVNAVLAGPLPTDAFRAVFAEGADDRLRELNAANPSGRGLELKDVAETVAFLASPEAAMIQGQVITVDGGNSLR
ncbi:MAG: SDR family oxidoreductase [Actinobacteria bacterium]|nr:SDR family oxidoreductase [Actinomycetota bacterium]